MKIGKYEFNSKEQAIDKIESLGIDEDGNPTHKHTVVLLGFLTLVEGTYDDEGNVITEPVISDKYSVDVMWSGLDKNPYGWATYEIDLESEGVHGFFGRSYIENKI